MENLIAYFKPDQKEITKEQTYVNGGLLVALLLFIITYENNCYYYGEQLAIKTRTAVSSLIYRKSLQLSESSVMKMSSGRIVSLISKDLYMINEMLFCVINVPVSIVHLMVMTYVMYRAIGISTIIGVGYMFLVLPFQRNYFQLFRKRTF